MMVDSYFMPIGWPTPTRGVPRWGWLLARPRYLPGSHSNRDGLGERDSEPEFGRVGGEVDGHEGGASHLDSRVDLA